MSQSSRREAGGTIGGRAEHGTLTYEDLLAFPDDGLRRELVDGVLFVSPSPNVRHQRIARRVLNAFENHLVVNGGGEVFVAPLDGVFSRSTVVEPDIFFVA